MFGKPTVEFRALPMSHKATSFHLTGDLTTNNGKNRTRLLQGEKSKGKSVKRNSKTLLMT